MRRIMPVVLVGAVIFFIATQPDRAAEVYGHLRDSFWQVGEALGRWLKSVV